MDKINHCINHNRFIPIDTEELSALELMGKGTEKTNELVDKSNDHEERITNNEKKKVSFDDMKEKFKFDNNFSDIDYRGKWFGLDEPTLSDEGMRSQVQKNRDDIIKTNEQLDSITQQKMDKNTTDISVSQINKNKGKLDQTYMTDEFLQQITGNAPIHAIPSDESITQRKMAIPYIEGYPNKNLFNKYDITIGYYFSPTDGVATPTGNNEWCVSSFIRIKSNTNYSKNCTLAYYDANKNFISGSVASEIYKTSPTNAVYCRLSILTSELNTIQLEEGTKNTTFEEYKIVSTRDKIKGCYGKNVLLVDKQNGDFKTITEAVAYCKIHSNINNPHTILLSTGVYNEFLQLPPNSHFSIIGLDRERCVIIDYTGDYYKAPISMSSNVILDNLTIRTHAGYDVKPSLLAYAIHHDSEGEGTSIIRNCIIYSQNNCAIGIGLQNKQTLILENCDLFSTEQQALLVHPSPLAGHVQQKLIVRKCTLYSNDGKVLSFIDSNNNGNGAGDNRDTTLTFQNNIVYSYTAKKNNLIYGTSPMNGEHSWGYMKLTDDSWGNNISELNI